MIADPVDAFLDAERDRDHAQARRRGERVVRLADRLLRALVARGLLPAGQLPDARVTVFHALAEELYGTLAIDVPDLRED